MRPGQLEPNEFEVAILERIAQEDPSIKPALKELRVVSREYTGVGCYTTFLRDKTGEAKEKSWDRTVELDVMIQVPGPPNGLLAILFCKGDQPDFLELVTVGDEYWDGVYEGFSMDESA